MFSARRSCSTELVSRYRGLCPPAPKPRWLGRTRSSCIVGSARFRALGGYDDKLNFNEDAEFDRRLIKSGGRIWLADDLVVTYVPRKNTISLFKQYVKHGRGRAHTFARHGGRYRIRHFILPSIAPMIILALLAPFYWPIAVPASSWALVCLSYGIVLGIKHRDFCSAASGYASMVMQIAWSCGHWQETIAIRAKRLFGARESRRRMPANSGFPDQVSDFPDGPN